MKEVQIVAYCDGERHEEGDLVAAVVERTISIDGSQTVVLDLCQSCDSIFTLMLTLMDRGAVEHPSGKKKAATTSRGGRKPNPAGVATGRGNAPLTSIPLEGPHICPECQFESKSRAALGQHLSSKHSKGFKDYIIGAEAS